MKGQWHINDKGEVKKCGATVQCPFENNSGHFDDKKSAIKSAEKFNEKSTVVEDSTASSAKAVNSHHVDASDVTVNFKETGTNVYFGIDGSKSVVFISKIPIEPEEEFHIDEIVVDEKDRGKGYASRLLDEVTKWAVENKNVVTLDAQSLDSEHGLSTEQLREFYGRHGFMSDSHNGLMYFDGNEAANSRHLASFSDVVSHADEQFFSEGNCAIFAEALEDYLYKEWDKGNLEYPPSGVMVLGKDPDVVESLWDHAVVQLGNKYIDVTGVFTEEQLLNKWNSISADLAGHDVWEPTDLQIYDIYQYERYSQEWGVDDDEIRCNGRLDASRETKARANDLVQKILKAHSTEIAELTKNLD